MSNTVKLDTNVKGLLFFTDYHAHIFTEFSQPDKDYITDRFRFQIQVLENLFEICKEKNYILVFGGDLFHKRGLIDIRVFNHVFSIFEKYREVPSILVRGNHDSTTNSLYTDSSLDTFNSLPKCIVVSTPKAIILSDDTIINCLPYGEEIDEMKNYLHSSIELVKSCKNKFLIAHIGVQGSSTGKYNHTLDGAFTLTDLSPDTYDYVLLGHYHKRQNLGNLPNVLYGGNPIQQTFSDEGQTKGYHLIDFSNKHLDFVVIPQKMFITCNLDHLPEESVLENNYIRLEASSKDIDTIEQIKNSYCMTNVKLTVRKELDTTMRLNVSATSSPTKITEEYIKQYMKDSPEGILEKALSCVVEAMNQE